MKTCGKCEQDKPRIDFYRDRGNEDGYEDVCKLCHWPPLAQVGTKRYRTIYSKLVPLMRRMSRDERSAAVEWFRELLEILPEPLQKEVE